MPFLLVKIIPEAGKQDLNQYTVYEIKNGIDDKNLPIKIKQQIAVTSKNELLNQKAQMELQLADVNAKLAQTT